MKKHLNDLKESFKELVRNDFKFIICLVLLVIICYMPLNYYIVVGGGISDLSKRVSVDNSYEAEGSFNLSYVKESKGVLLNYLLSYIFDWEKIDIGDYKYDEEESLEDIDFRSNLDLLQANSKATYLAYTHANKKIELVDSHLYVKLKHPGLDDCNIKVGDEILEIDGHSVKDLEYSKYINDNFNEGDFIEVKLIRKGKEKVVTTKIYKIDNKLMIGLYLSTLKEYKTNPEINIKFKKSESGPSAGLMTTLTIYNQLVEEDITKGLTIAGTGTIDEYGNVGPIGGVEYKLLGAAKGKADIFLVPKDTNYEEALKVVKKKKLKIKLIPVSTFEEALAELNKI